jgi:methyl-accepting chemotaxis protein
MNPLSNASLTVKLVGSFLVTSVLATVLGLFALVQLDGINQTSTEMETRWMPGVQAAGEMETRINMIRRDELQHILSASEADLAKYESQLADTKTKLATARSRYAELPAEADAKAAYDAFARSWSAYETEHDRVIALSRAGRNEDAKALNRGDAAKRFREAAAELTKIVEINTRGAAAAAERGDALYATSRSRLITGLAIIAALGLALGWLIARAITVPLAGALTIFARIQQGHFDNRIDVKTGDEVGRVLRGLAEMQAKLKEQIERDRAAAAENGRIRTALDKVSTSVMLVDVDGRIIYANEAVEALFGQHSGELGRALPGFDPRRLVGQAGDALYRTVQHPPLATLAGTHTVEMKLGGVTLKSVASPVVDASGHRLGTAVQWFDRTLEVGTEEEINECVRAALDGDLMRRVRTEGKSGFFAMLADGMNRLLGNMADVVRSIKATANEVSSGADEISRGNANLSQRTEEQASSLEETASSMEEMTSTVRQNADNAQQANQLAATARGQAEKGGTIVAQAVSAMSEINASSKRIADIIGVIDEIAFQTNLLALNAAVEAARAGEQGRGFAVVASEVRNLASRSAEAAKEIKSLIQDSVQRVEEGSKLVDQSGQALTEIMGAVKKVADIVAEISAASQEQSAGIEQVNKAVVSMDEVTQQNAALVEEAAAAAQALTDQARGMTEAMAKYRTGESAGAPPPATRKPSTPGSTYRGPERRGPGRPFTRKAKAAAEATPAPRAAGAAPAASAEAAQEWNEF